MSIDRINIISFIKGKMKWHQARQRVLAANVANADSPRYRPQDLKPFTFEETLKVRMSQSVRTLRTHNAHFRGNEISSLGNRADSDPGSDFEITPAGNAVVLEDQMIKVAGNQFDFQLASTLYSRSLGLLKTAIGRRG